MSATVAVLCPKCEGASADYRLPPCGECMNQGHLYLTPRDDGSLPPWDGPFTGRPVTLWCPPLLPDTPMNPLVLRSQQVGP